MKIENNSHGKDTILKPENTPFNDWIKKWNDRRKETIAYSTWRNHDYFRRVHIKPELGEVPIKDLTTQQIQDFINYKYKQGKINGEGGLNLRTVKYLYTTIHASLDDAVKSRILQYNVSEPVDLPKKKKKKDINYLTKQQAKLFLDTSKDSRFYTAFLLELHSGLRKGELLALHWEDIDFKQKSLTVNKTLYRTPEGLEIKVINSFRTIPLSNKVINQLKQHKSEQNKNLLVDPYHNKELVFCLENGKPIDPRIFYREFKRVLNKTGLPDIRFYDLRKTYAKLISKTDVPERTVKEILGRSSIEPFSDLYSDGKQNNFHEAAEKIAKKLSIE